MNPDDLFYKTITKIITVSNSGNSYYGTSDDDLGISLERAIEQLVSEGFKIKQIVPSFVNKKEDLGRIGINYQIPFLYIFAERHEPRG